MKSSKLFIAVGGFLLSISTFLATKANKKFTGTNIAYVPGAGINLTLSVGNHLTITDNGKGQAMFFTSTSNGYELRTAIFHYKTLYFN